jgi:hypothetical protein
MGQCSIDTTVCEQCPRLTFLLQVDIVVPKRPVLGAEHAAFRGPTRGVSVLHTTNHLSLTDVRLVCPKPAVSTIGITWVPTKIQSGGPVAPVFSATGCTIEGFQVRCVHYKNTSSV